MTRTEIIEQFRDELCGLLLRAFHEAQTAADRGGVFAVNHAGKAMIEQMKAGSVLLARIVDTTAAKLERAEPAAPTDPKRTRA